MAIVVLNHGLWAQEVNNLKRDGAFGFPQAQAQVLCDSEALRVSAWSNEKYLFVQSIVWKDSDSELVDVRGNKFGDYSQLVLDVDGDRRTTPLIDRTYSVGAFPGMRGLRYQVATSERSWTPSQLDSQG